MCSNDLQLSILGECNLTWKGGNIKTTAWRGKAEVQFTIIELIMKALTRSELFVTLSSTVPCLSSDICGILVFNYGRILIGWFMVSNFHLRDTDIQGNTWVRLNIPYPPLYFLGTFYSRQMCCFFISRDVY